MTADTFSQPALPDDLQMRLAAAGAVSGAAGGRARGGQRMKSPGYKTAPVETGYRIDAAASPVDGALLCSRAIDRPAVVVRANACHGCGRRSCERPAWMRSVRRRGNARG